MATLERAGYAPASEPIPVSPASHYAIGGIVTDLDGTTTVPGLYAAGECACTGVHGANRLASNSLLECLVFGRRAGLAALSGPALEADAAPLEHFADPGRELWRGRWPDPQRGRSHGAARRAAPACAPRCRERARAGGEPRRPLPRRLPGRKRRVLPGTSSSIPDASRSSSNGADARRHRPRRRRSARRRRRQRRRDDTRARARRRSLPRRASPQGARRRLRDSRRCSRFPGARPVGHGRGDARGGLGRVRGSDRRRRHRGSRASGAQRRARRAQPCRPPQRNRLADAPLCGADRGHAGPYPRHAQDHSGAARAREVRRSLRRRDQPPRRSLRRDPHQGQPHPRRRRHRRGARAR